MCEIEREMRSYHETLDHMSPEEREQEEQSMLFEMWKDQQMIDQHDAEELANPTDRMLTSDEQDDERIPF